MWMDSYMNIRDVSVKIWLQSSWRTKIWPWKLYGLLPGFRKLQIEKPAHRIFLTLRVAGRGQRRGSDRWADPNTTGLPNGLPLYSEDVGDELGLNKEDERDHLVGPPRS
ncbi:hypothetical protein U1Q18_027186 [Sarracenia purpurea var. burkii]